MADLIFRDPRFDALRNALYHTERRNFLDFSNRLLNFVVIVLGASVAGKAAGLFSIQEHWLELSVVLFATMQLVFDFGGRARSHEFLQRRYYYELLSEMESENLDNEKTKRKWSVKLLTIAGDEPMPMRALDAIAYNKALAATCDDLVFVWNNRQHVTFVQIRLRHIFAFHSAQFPPESEHVEFWTKLGMRLRRIWKRDT